MKAETQTLMKLESDMIDIERLPVHPAAEVYPMIDADEMTELADDIKENGQNHPVVVAEIDGTMMVVDGRNRLAACKLAGVQPVWAEADINTDGQARAYILSENNMRRHMTAGQKAMAHAMVIPKAQGKRTDLGDGNLLPIGIKLDVTEKKNLSQARTILKFEPEKAKTVIAGGLALNAAYEAAKETKRLLKAEAEEEQQRRYRFATLKSTNPDIAENVEKGDKTLEEGEADAEEARRAAHANLVSMALQMDKIEGVMLSLEKQSARNDLHNLINNHADVLKSHAFCTPEKLIKDMQDMVKGAQQFLNEVKK